MKKSLFSQGMLTTILVMLGSVSLLSCGNDDEEDVNPVIDNPINEENGFWGTVRSSWIHEYNDQVDGQTFTYKTMTKIDFYNVGIAAAYKLYSTESVSFLKQVVGSDGKLIYDGTWTILKEHPEWSYFKGTYHVPDLDLSLSQFEQAETIPAGDIVDGGVLHIPGGDIEINTPGLLKYTLNLENNCLSLEEPEDNSYNGWKYLDPADQTLSVNFNSSKTSWSELRDKNGQLRWVRW